MEKDLWAQPFPEDGQVKLHAEQQRCHNLEEVPLVPL